jgi:hypothetical protein
VGPSPSPDLEELRVRAPQLSLDDLEKEIAKWRTLVDYLKQRDPRDQTHFAYDVLNSLERIRRQKLGR